jgi:hypothetical protein
MPTEHKATKSKTKVQRVVLLAKPRKPPKWWPNGGGGWVTVLRSGVGWTIGVDASEVTRCTSADDVERKLGPLSAEFNENFSDLGVWEFDVKVIDEARARDTKPPVRRRRAAVKKKRGRHA